MTGTPKCMQMPHHRLEKLHDGKLATIQRLDYQHYLVWINGTPITEVNCIPVDSGRWYWRGSLAFNWAKTRSLAIRSGRICRSKGVRIDGSPLQQWTDLARSAIAKATGGAA